MLVRKEILPATETGMLEVEGAIVIQPLWQEPNCGNLSGIMGYVLPENPGLTEWHRYTAEYELKVTEVHG